MRRNKKSIAAYTISGGTGKAGIIYDQVSNICS